MNPTSTCVIVAPEKAEEEKGLSAPSHYSLINVTRQDAIVQLSTFYVRQLHRVKCCHEMPCSRTLCCACLILMFFLFFYRSVFHSLHSHLLSTYP